MPFSSYLERMQHRFSERHLFRRGHLTAFAYLLMMKCVPMQDY